MTKFRYSEYLSQFRNAGRKAGDVACPPSPPNGRRRRSESGERDGASGSEDVEPMVCAIRRGDVDALNAMMSSSSSSSSSLLKESKDGWIPLHDAAYWGQTDCLKTLLRAHPASVDKRTLEEQTALLLAVSRQHVSCVGCLLQVGADPDISNYNKVTPLFKACELEHVEMVTLILSHGASVNQRCGQGWTALHEAVSRNNTHISDLLVQAGATINPVNTYSITPLIVAAQRGQMTALCYLIDKGADVNMQTCDGVTGLHEASRHGHKEIVSLLLKKNADANKPTNSGLLPLHFAAQHGHPEVVSLLVSGTSRARLRQCWISPLHLAAQHDRPAVAAVLLKTGADVNATLAPAHSNQYPDGRATALYWAAANGSARTAEVLLKAGASVSLDPVSPLLMAVYQGCVSTVTSLLDHGGHGGHVTLPSFPTSFPPLIALSMKKLTLLERLLANGCDATSCFSCSYGSDPHPPASENQLTLSSVGEVFHSDSTLCLNCVDPPVRPIQFCEWISTPALSSNVGPIVDLLLEHVGQVTLCQKLLELLDKQEEWRSVKRKSLSPRPLMHLCRFRIRVQMGRDRLRSMAALDLPTWLIKYLSVPLR